MIRCVLANRIEDGEQKLPPVEKAWSAHWRPGGWIPLTPENSVANCSERASVCPECGDRRVFLGDNYPDFADPVVDAYLTRMQYDPDANTIGDKHCGTCHGMEYRGPSTTEICGVYHSTFLMKRILALPGVRVAASVSAPNTLLFRAEGFEGVSMGVME
jgi:hypothetical protein